ncbi:MAG: dihydrolipoamide acetyltransferase family protein [Planctomycetota bacterium]
MFEFKLPDLGEGVHEGQVVNVLVKEGDTIAEYQPMLEVETDKAAVEIPSPRAGVVTKVHVVPGAMVKVGQVLVSIDDSGAPAGDGRGTEPAERPAAAPAPKPPAEPAPASLPVTTAGSPLPASKPAAPTVPAPAPVKPAATAPAAPTGKAAAGPVPAAPAVRKLAREKNVDLAQIAGSGPGGRVLREDVERAASGQPTAALAATTSAPPAPVGAVEVELPDFSQYGPVRRERVSQIRKTIARQMTRAWLNVPRVTHCDTADITELERNRVKFNEAVKEGQAKLTLTAIALKAVAAALRDFPVLNSSYDPASDEIIYKEYTHVGVAVDSPRGLVVPVLRDVDRKSLPQIAAELEQIAANVRAVKFDIKDLRGASFTITNYGAVGGVFGTPMVNYPEVAILGMGRAKLQPTVLDGQITPRLILPLSLSFDHRVVDGADAARFTTEVIRTLENPLRMISLT